MTKKITALVIGSMLMMGSAFAAYAPQDDQRHHGDRKQRVERHQQQPQRPHVGQAPQRHRVAQAPGMRRHEGVRHTPEGARPAVHRQGHAVQRQGHVVQRHHGPMPGTYNHENRAMRRYDHKWHREHLARWEHNRHAWMAHERAWRAHQHDRAWRENYARQNAEWHRWHREQVEAKAWAAANPNEVVDPGNSVTEGMTFVQALQQLGIIQ